MRKSLAVLLVGLAVAQTAHAERPPWRARRRAGVMSSERAGTLVEPGDWPAEPASPRTVDRARFALALRTLCGFMPPGRQDRYAEWIVGDAAEAHEDPFLLGALVFRMGRCDPQAQDLDGVGLTLIASNMYWESLRHGVYRYQVREHGAWVTRERQMPRLPFGTIARAETNLYFAAQLLSAWRDQHDSVDAAFEQVPHRSHVSHWIWGDRVRSARAEDRILTDRRRLLFYYGDAQPMAPRRILGVTMGAPLDGGPRVVSSWLGSERAEGARTHRGVDVEAAFGEPVRVIADGRVSFAGVDLPGGRASTQMTREQIDATPRDSLGPGGRYVCVVHSEGEARLTSCYMHLEEVHVRAGDHVTRGQQLGTVGRTGMQVSAPHLHLELHGPDGLLDASEHMRGFLIGRMPPGEAPARRR